MVYLGDCKCILPLIDANAFHAIVTDPPYGLEFMGKEWDAPWKNDGKIEVCDEGMDESHPFRDGTRRICYGNKKVHARQHRAGELSDPVKAKYLRHNVEYVRDSHLYQQWFQDCASAMLRVMKPGAHLLSFGGTRMWHRMACAIEDAGFDVRDTVAWVYATGFPKSHDIGKAIDKMHGAEREVIGPGSAALSQGQFNSREVGSGGYGYNAEYSVTAPATDDARKWDGWGSALKPSHEPIIVARRPLAGTLAANTLEHGCGGLNIDACRVGTDPMPLPASDGTIVSQNTSMAAPNTGRINLGTKNGRWPANLIHDGSDEVVELFPHTKSVRSTVTSKPGTVDGAGRGLPAHTGVYGFNDDGSAARFFYTAKADKDDRPHGKEATVHPTVKPLNLMRYLVRLVCARGGIVLDPFMGSGSTGCAAIIEGMYFVGIEKSVEYADIAVGRLKMALESSEQVDRLITGNQQVIDNQPPQPKRLF